MCFFAFYVYIVSKWPIEHYRLKVAFYIGERARGARGAAAPPNFGRLRLFGQREKIWAKSVFKDVSILFQPSKLKFLLGRHLATNSFGLGRLFYKSSRQLQNFRRHGD